VFEFTRNAETQTKRLCKRRGELVKLIYSLVILQIPFYICVICSDILLIFYLTTELTIMNIRWRTDSIVGISHLLLLRCNEIGLSTILFRASNIYIVKSKIPNTKILRIGCFFILQWEIEKSFDMINNHGHKKKKIIPI